MEVRNVAKSEPRYGAAFQKSHPGIARYIRNHPKLKMNSEGVQAARRALNKRRRHKNNPKKPSDVDTAAPWQIIYGTARTGGTITFAHVPEANPEMYYLVITLAGHEIDGIDAIHFGKETVNFSGSLVDGSDATGKWAGYVYAQLRRGSEGQTALSQLIADLPSKWDSDSKQSGCAHIYFRLKYKEDLFPQGLPEITFTIRGKKVYDPRTDTIYFSNNAALCTLDYLTDTRYGCGVLDEDVDLDNIGWAANICGETMPEPTGSTSDPGIRYSVDGILDTDDSPQDVLEMMSDAMGGFIFMTGGVWRLQPGVWIGPTVSIDDNDFIGEINVKTRIPRKESFNSVRGTFVSPKWDYEEGDFPPVTSSLYLNQDNGWQLWDDITLPLTTHSTTGQRLGKLHLERVRQPMTFTARVHPRILQLTPIDTVNVTRARLGWSSKEFEIIEMSPELQETEGGPVLGAVCTFKETASEIYDWNEGLATTVDFAPETELPDAFYSAPPTSLTLQSGDVSYYIRTDGTVAPRILASWVSPAATLVTGGGHYEIEWKRHSSPDWTNAENEIVSSNVTSAFLADVQSGVSYDVRVRTVNALGATSTWLEGDDHTVVGKTAPPSDVTLFTIAKEQAGNRFNWEPIADLDLSEYEIRIGSSWAAGVWFVDTRSTDFFWSVRTAGTYEFFIKAIDTSGNYSASAAYAALTIAEPSDPPSITYTIEGDTVVVSWTPSTSDYPIEDYGIWLGQDWGTAEYLGATKGTMWRKKADWSSWKNFYVIARDVAGNASHSSGFVTVAINNPNPVQNLVAKTVDNNILLDWDDPSPSTLAIARYKVYKGATFGTATFLGSVDGTFATYIETLGGNFIYWIVAVDLAGHESTAVSIAAVLYNPPDYIVRALDNLQVTYGGVTPSNVITQSQIVAESAASFIAPVDATETYAQHFTNNSQTTFAGFSSAGFTYLMQPTPTAGTTRAEWKIDYGAVLPESVIQLSYTKTDIAGTTTATPNISYSADDVTYTAGTAGAARVFAQNFRYAKIKLDIAATDNKGLTRISNITAKLDVKKQTDSGTVAVTTVAGGTVVNFNLPFLSVSAINVTPQGTAARMWVVDFAGGASPTSFKVLLFDSAGARVAGSIYWTAEGVINVI